MANPGMAPQVQAGIQGNSSVPMLNQVSPGAPMQAPPPPMPQGQPGQGQPMPAGPAGAPTSDEQMIIKAFVDRLKFLQKIQTQESEMAMGGGMNQYQVPR